MHALICTDVQNDFLPGGALAVPRGEQVIPVINGLIPRFELVVATQDWHPPHHGSFAANHAGRAVGDVIELDGLEQVLWPVHCVQGSPGAAFAESLRLPVDTVIVRKGLNPRVDSYSGFFDNGHRQATELESVLRERGVERLFVTGLATDYCVKFTALDAVELGFETMLVIDACRGVELNEGDIDRALEEMRRAGVRVITSAQAAC